MLKQYFHLENTLIVKDLILTDLAPSIYFQLFQDFCAGSMTCLTRSGPCPQPLLRLHSNSKRVSTFFAINNKLVTRFGTKFSQRFFHLFDTIIVNSDRNELSMNSIINLHLDWLEINFEILSNYLLLLKPTFVLTWGGRSTTSLPFFSSKFRPSS